MAAISASKHVKNGSIVGLGSGTTVVYAFQELSRKIKETKLNIVGVPTSYQASQIATKYGIPLTTLDENPQLDITLDGADQIDNDLNMIKGMGGALTKEKIVASASRMNIIMVDETKLTEKLGINQPVPIEVIPFALPLVQQKLRHLGSNPILREAKKKLGPVITDNGNLILDVDFGPIDNPKELNQILKVIPGIVETGLFLELADIIYVGRKETTSKLEKK
ncbi:MAG: ribose 5-phosphate isomerase A [Candidatus Bathyarchaeota archaeon]|nr:MAG: ribose 5-phosphate isomerase A [Candidatus Bathyarchaeota archaeon]